MIQINNRPCGDSEKCLNLPKGGSTECRKYSLPCRLDSNGSGGGGGTIASLQQQYSNARHAPSSAAAADTLSKSTNHCNGTAAGTGNVGVSQKSRALNVEGVRWSKYKDKRKSVDPEAGSMLLQLNNETESSQPEQTEAKSLIYEVTDERIMWL